MGSDKEIYYQSMKKYTKEWSDGEANLEIIVSGERKEGVSGTNMRNYAKENNFEKFKENLPLKINSIDAKNLFNSVKIGLEN